jgi:rhodanese-related sulfurtransferase
MKLLRPIFCLVLSIPFMAMAQYKNDNKLFKTVYVEDLCRQLDANPNYLILDVRSKGEYEDTSASLNLNLGHLKNAKNIDIRELPSRWKEISDYKEKPVFVYCSHSQRSRRASKLLADSGFVNVININGGLTTFNIMQTAIGICKQKLYETHNSYPIYSAMDLCNATRETVLLDIRSDSVYNGIAKEEYRNPFGKIKSAIHIPLTSLESSLDKLPKDKTILIIDEFGSESPRAAKLLTEKGYNHPGILLGGMEGIQAFQIPTNSCKSDWWTPTRKYNLLNADEFDAFAKKNPDAILLDVRKQEEFENKSKETFRNVGHINNAKSIPSETLPSRVNELGDNKNRPIIIYAFSGQPEIYNAAKLLTDLGYTNVNVLLGGVFNLRWRAANLKGKEHLKDWVVDVPAENL